MTPTQCESNWGKREWAGGGGGGFLIVAQRRCFSISSTSFWLVHPPRGRVVFQKSQAGDVGPLKKGACIFTVIVWSPVPPQTGKFPMRRLDLWFCPSFLSDVVWSSSVWRRRAEIWNTTMSVCTALWDRITPTHSWSRVRLNFSRCTSRHEYSTSAEKCLRLVSRGFKSQKMSPAMKHSLHVNAWYFCTLIFLSNNEILRKKKERGVTLRWKSFLWNANHYNGEKKSRWKLKCVILMRNPVNVSSKQSTKWRNESWGRWCDEVTTVKSRATLQQ